MREKPEVQAKVMALGVQEKWIMLQSYRQKLAKEQAERDLGDTHNEAEFWITVVNVEPTAAKLQQLCAMLRTQPIQWVEEFVMLRGVSALCDLLELYVMKQLRSEMDCQVMLQALLCVKTVMNVELGMEAMVGGAAFMKLQEEMHKAGAEAVEGAALDMLLRPQESGLVKLVQCLESRRESTTACAVQNEALLLLGAAVMYSAEAHTITLEAFERVKMERRRVQRFGDLVDSCQPPSASRESSEAAKLVVAQNQVCAHPRLLRRCGDAAQREGA